MPDILKNINWTLVISLVTALAALITAIRTMKNVSVTEKMLQEAKINRQETFRPHITVNSIQEIKLWSPEYIENEEKWRLPFNIMVNIENYGKQPANDLAIYATLENSEMYTIDKYPTTRVSLLRSDQQEEVRLTSNICGEYKEVVKTINNFCSPIFAFSPMNVKNAECLRYNITLTVHIIYKNFINEIYVAEASFYIIPKNIQSVSLFESMAKELKENPENLKDANKRSKEPISMTTIAQIESLKEIRLTSEEYETKIKKLQENVSVWSLNE